MFWSGGALASTLCLRSSNYTWFRWTSNRSGDSELWCFLLHFRSFCCFFGNCKTINAFSMLMCYLAWNLIAIEKLCLSEVQDSSQTLIHFKTRRSSCGKPQVAYHPQHNLSKLHCGEGGGILLPPPQQRHTCENITSRCTTYVGDNYIKCTDMCSPQKTFLASYQSLLEFLLFALDLRCFAGLSFPLKLSFLLC